ALASTHGDTLWIVWASQRKQNWDLYARAYKNGKLGEEIRLTDGGGPNLWHRMTTDNKGRAWLVWQAAEGGKYRILARSADGDTWNPKTRLASPHDAGNAWD